MEICFYAPCGVEFDPIETDTGLSSFCSEACAEKQREKEAAEEGAEADG